MPVCPITRRRLLTCEAASRASPRGAILAAVPLGVFAEGAHVPGAHDEADTRADVSCARASFGVFAETEQHVGQLLDGAASCGRRGSTITLLADTMIPSERSPASGEAITRMPIERSAARGSRRMLTARSAASGTSMNTRMSTEPSATSREGPLPGPSRSRLPVLRRAG